MPPTREETTIELIDRKVEEEVAEIMSKNSDSQGISFLKDWWPVILTIAALIGWGYRLESRVDSLSNDTKSEMSHMNKELESLTIHRASTDAQFTALKIEQTKVQGQIEALTLMIRQLQDTATRIERILEKKQTNEQLLTIKPIIGHSFDRMFSSR